MIHLQNYELFILACLVVLMTIVFALAYALHNIFSKGVIRRKKLMSIILLLVILAIFSYIAYSFYQIDSTLVTHLL
jgi:hypothetical protein